MICWLEIKAIIHTNIKLFIAIYNNDSINKIKTSV